MLKVLAQLYKLEKMTEIQVKINSWLLPCSLRSHRIANLRQKMGFAIFRLYPPTTLKISANRTTYHIEQKFLNRKNNQQNIQKKVYLCKNISNIIIQNSEIVSLTEIT